jgi:hypothetical protein
MNDVYIYRIIKKIQSIVLVIPQIYNQDEWATSIQKNINEKNVTYRIILTSLNNRSIFTAPVFKDELELINYCDIVYNKFKK